MANNPTENLAQALSSFWLRLFADKDVISSLFQGAEQMLGQAYLDTLETVLGRSLNLAPVYHKEYWKLLTLRSDQVTLIPGPSSPQDQYILPLPDSVVDLQFLFDKVYSPAVTLEKGFDFTVQSTSGDAQIVFTGTDPFTIAGIPSRKLDVVPFVRSSGADGKVTASSNVFQTASGQPNFTRYNIGDTLLLTSATQGGSYRVVSVNLDGSLVLDTTFSSSEIELKWTLKSPGTVTQLALWAPNALIDRRVLADNFGYLIGKEKPSSEAYRAFLQGIFQYFLLGPGLARVEGALNAAIGLPVVRTEGETVLVIDTNQVITDKQVYPLPEGSVKQSLTLGQSLPAFSSLTDIFRVADYISDPTWWWNITIPQELLPDEGVNRRQVTPGLVPTTYQDGQTDLLYGDPALYYGTDDNGIVPPSPMVPYRHGFGYLVMDRLLKYNMFGIFAQPGYVPIDFGTSVIQSVIDAGKPAYTMLYAAPLPALTDPVTVTDSLSVVVNS